MFNSSTTPIWYGRLTTSKSTTAVIYDPKLPQASKGQIYLFNAERGAIIKYVESVVTPLLEDIDREERNEMKKALKKPWESVRKAFLREHGGGLFNTKTKAPAKIEAAASANTPFDAPDLDDDWSDADEVGMV